jgi:hypothetical protein
LELNLPEMRGSWTPPDHAPEAAQQAVALYEQASRPGLGRRLWAVLRRQPQRLLTLACIEAAASIGGRHYLGLQVVPIARIRGTEGRNQDFDATFHPLSPHSRDRWMKIAAAQQAGATLPPVELIQVGDIYFVRDGHHRISVAAALGQTEIDAEVTVWQTRPACACAPAAA